MDGSLVVAANNSGTCYVWRAMRGSYLTTHFEPLHKLRAHQGAGEAAGAAARRVQGAPPRRLERCSVPAPDTDALCCCMCLPSPPPLSCAPPGYVLKCMLSPDVRQLATTSSDKTVKLWNLDGFTLDAATLASSPMLPYLAMVAAVIERRAIHFEELLPALRRSMRQRSFDRLPRREYVLRFLDRHPP